MQCEHAPSQARPYAVGVPSFATFSNILNGERDAPSELPAAGFAFLLALVSGEEVMKDRDEPVRFLAGGEANGLAPPPDISAPLITFEICTTQRL